MQMFPASSGKKLFRECTSMPVFKANSIIGNSVVKCRKLKAIVSIITTHAGNQQPFSNVRSIEQRNAVVQMS